MRRALSRLWRFALLVLAVAALGNLLLDLDDFIHLGDTTCVGTEPRTDDWCTGTYHLRCLPKPAHCTGDLAYIPPNQFDFHQIIPPVWGHASILGYAWWLLEWAIGLLVNAALLIAYVVCQPLAYNPLLWWILIMIARTSWSRGPGVDPRLELVRNQKALGDASTATRLATHQALLGGGTAPVRQFSE